MTKLNPFNSVFTELKPEDAAAINGGFRFEVTETNETNHYLVKKFKGDQLRWSAIVDNNGTINYLKDDDVSFQSGPQPKYYGKARLQAKRRVKRYLNNA